MPVLAAVIVLFSSGIIIGTVQTEDHRYAVDIILDNGYSVEDHKDIQTEDGYLLDMQRIPYGKKNDTETGRPPVLLMHGLLSSAESWVVTGEKSLAFILADAGYDVWLGNARGTTHSRKHVKLNPDTSSRYWQFSWHEIGVYDLPAKINYILETTGEDKLFYVGHSQGTTSFFVMASVRPQFNEKIRLMTALAPVAFMSHIKNPFFRALSLFGTQLNFMLGTIGMNEVLPNSDIFNMASKALCEEQAISVEMCTNGLFLTVGYDSKQLNRTALPAILKGSPAGASSYQLTHYAQLVNSGTFSYYDYGLLRNMAQYNSIFPPNYKLNKITSPVALYYAKNDQLVNTQDVEILEKRLPNVVESYLIPYSDFNHIDFMWASNIVDMLYNKVIDKMNQF